MTTGVPAHAQAAGEPHRWSDGSRRVPRLPARGSRAPAGRRTLRHSPCERAGSRCRHGARRPVPLLRRRHPFIQLLMEEVTGMSTTDLVAQLVLEPLGMRASTFVQEYDDDERAHGHRPGTKPVPGGWRVQPEQCAAGLWTTPADHLRFMKDPTRVRRRPRWAPHFVDDVRGPDTGCGPAVRPRHGRDEPHRPRTLHRHSRRCADLVRPHGRQRRLRLRLNGERARPARDRGDAQQRQRDTGPETAAAIDHTESCVERHRPRRRSTPTPPSQ
jgi:hypothetical protein